MEWVGMERLLNGPGERMDDACSCLVGRTVDPVRRKRYRSLSSMRPSY